MVGVGGLVGYHFSRNPTTAGTPNEKGLNIADNTVPWKVSGVENSDRNNYKYKYHPGGDYRNAPRQAPSALNSVIVPGVTLPKVSAVVSSRLWRVLNCDRACMRSSTSMGRTIIRRA